MKKYIIKAALKYNGKIYTGFDHGECMKKIELDNHIILCGEIKEGFIASDGFVGEFVDRKEAMKIAKEAGQLQYYVEKETLISEDLHIDWLHRQQKEIKTLKRRIDRVTRNSQSSIRRERLLKKVEELSDD